MSVRVVGLWVGDRGRPEFLATGTPSVSWAVESDEPGWEQTRARVELRLDGVITGAEVAGPVAQRVAWPFAPLGPYTSAEVRVRPSGAPGSSTGWSAWTVVRTGPLDPQDWRAPFITLDPATHWPERGTVRFRTELTRPATVVSAVLSVTAHGVVDVTLAGRRVGDEELSPGWTAYRDVLAFSTYDVTHEISAAAADRPVVLGATVGEGWYGERFGFDGHFQRAYLGPVALAAQLRLVDADGDVTWVTTGTDWTVSTVGPVTSASIYQGESHDARLADDALETPGTSLPGGGPAALLADVLAGDPRAEEARLDRLVPASSPPVRVTESVPVRDVLTTASGATVLDFGQNLVGRLRLRVDGPAGTTITLRHAEVLEHGELGVRPLRFAKATDSLVLAGDGPLDWHPRFTYHGFRYAEVTGWPGDLDPGAVVAEVLHTDLVRTGHLTTSDPLLNRLHENIVWGLRGNAVSLPTDCPQRDERLGWTGDIQVFTPTASFLYDVSGFLGSWLRDLAVEQDRGTSVPVVVPDPLPYPMPPAAAWGDAATLVPDALYDRYGDASVLAAQYRSMAAWVEDVRALAGDRDLWTGGFQFGDWLDPAAPPDRPAAARTDADIVASAYYFRSCVALARAARVLGRAADAVRYTALADRIRTAFLAEFVTPAGRMMSDAQTAYGLAIAFGLVDAERLGPLGDRLAELVRAHGYRIGTGFVGTPIVADALTTGGHGDVAFRLLLERECPSWLYPVTMGATTIWERWDSMLPDGTINPGEMTSFNHYALGAVGDFLHRRIGGIATAEPGSRVVDVAPVPGGGLTSAECSLDTGYGVVTVAWTLEEGTFALHVHVPAGMRARVTLPTGVSTDVGSGEHALTCTVQVAPEPGRPVWDLDTPMSAFMDDDQARETLLAACAAESYGFAHGWTSDGRWRADTTLRQSLMLLTPDALARIEKAIGS
ncbi:family 78 glycoside hydrolase catalytic domain [Cellulomonas sp. McL0617]|uniref:alpha-L-rhamnosidase n=1 Tax=Cellulomonas sp. McL0617 TaxID=3415675 RepID=UPI003CF61DDE